MGNYKENLEEAVRKYQPDVENLFGVSLGNITCRPFETSNKNPKNKLYNFIFRNLFNDDQEKKSSKLKYAHVNSRYSGLIEYNSSPELDSLPKFSAEYTAVHEMSHLADFKVSPPGYFPVRSPSVNELIANYAAHKILDLFESQEALGGVYRAERTDAIFLKSRLDKFKVSFKDYIKNFNRLENIWEDFGEIKI